MLIFWHGSLRQVVTCLTFDAYAEASSGSAASAGSAGAVACVWPHLHVWPAQEVAPCSAPAVVGPCLEPDLQRP